MPNPLALIACPDRALTRLVLLHVVIPSANSDPKTVHALPILDRYLLLLAPLPALIHFRTVFSSWPTLYVKLTHEYE